MIGWHSAGVERRSEVELGAKGHEGSGHRRRGERERELGRVCGFKWRERDEARESKCYRWKK